MNTLHQGIALVAGGEVLPAPLTHHNNTEKFKQAGNDRQQIDRVEDSLDQDLSNATSKHVDQFLDQPIDLVVTVCDGAKESCPTLPRVAEAVHWPFVDPADAEGSEEEQMQVFREVRDEIRTRIEHYLASSEV